MTDNRTLENRLARAVEREKRMETIHQDWAARLDRLCMSIEGGVSWESAGHLRGRSIGFLRQLAREIQTTTIRPAEDR